MGSCCSDGAKEQKRQDVLSCPTLSIFPLNHDISSDEVVISDRLEKIIVGEATGFKIETFALADREDRCSFTIYSWRRYQ